MFARSLFVLVFIVGIAAAEDAKPSVPAAMKPFEGVWKPDSIRYDGAEQLDAAGKEKMRLSIENGDYKLFVVVDPAKGLGQKVASSSLNVDASNKSFSLVLTDGPRKGARIHGIYEVSATTLKVCYGPATKPLPTTFDAPKGSPHFNEAWTREK